MVISDYIRVTDAELSVSWRMLSLDESKITAIDCRICFKKNVPIEKTLFSLLNHGNAIPNCFVAF